MSEVLAAVTRYAQTSPQADALSDGQSVLSYEALWRAVESLSGNLANLLTRDGPIAILLDNSPIWVMLDLSLIALGRVSVPLPPFFTPAQKSHALARAGAVYLIADHPNASSRNCTRLEFLGQFIHIFEQDEALVALPPSTAKITFTSGSTGEPKGVCLSQIGMEKVAASLVKFIGAEYAGIHCAVLPLSVLLENVAGLYPTLLSGGCYLAMPLANLGFGQHFRPDFERLVSALETSNATSSIIVPEILRGVIAVLAAANRSLPEMKLFAVGGARVSGEMLAKAANLGLPVFQGYGLSEAASVVAFNRPSENRLGSVGKILPDIDVRISPQGEVVIADPAFLGCLGDESAPTQFATGDLGHFDAAGYLHIDGRKSNLLITSFGRNVAPEWVESELLAQNSVGQAFVFGDGTPSLAALIVPSSMQVTSADIALAVEHANRGLPRYAQIRHWSKVAPFTPANHQLTGNGRLRRATIAQDYQKHMEKCLDHQGQYVGFFERLIEETAAERAYLQETPQIRDGLAGKISRETYLHYLAEAYHHVKHTVSLMDLARERLSPRQAWLIVALDEYIAEETGHEEWILDDIHHTGGDANAVRHGEPRFATELMVSYAYDFVSRINPAGFFGMVFVLESTSTQLASRGAGALMQALQLPERCFHYLLSHGALDLDHMKFFQSLMSQIEDPIDQDAIIHMAKAIFVLYSNLFRSIPHSPELTHVA